MVYVDMAQEKYGMLIMSHMLADTDEELHAMAKAIGVKRVWFQAHASTPHYDVSQNKRNMAIALGARVIGRNELVALVRRKREERNAKSTGSN